MSNVHEAITKHSNAQNKIVRTFVELEHLREEFIEEAVTLAEQKKDFSVDKINSITNQMNQLAKKGIVPLRKLVTIEMVKEYAERRTEGKADESPSVVHETRVGHS